MHSLSSRKVFATKRACARLSKARLAVELLEDRTVPSALINFDALDASAGPVAGATLASYLGGFGVSLSDVTVGTSVGVWADQNLYGGQPVDPSSPPNVLTQGGLNDPVTFTLNFSTPLDSFAFTRPQLEPGPNGVTHPAWQAYAFDASGALLSSASEALLASYSVIPASTFALDGPGVASVRFDSQNQNFAGFSAVLLDDLVLTSSVPSEATYTFRDFGGLGGEGCQANAINDAGQIIGASDVGQGETHPFLWQNDVMSDLGTFGGAQGSALGINDAGQISGYAWEGGGFDRSRAFRWENGALTDLGDLSSSYHWAFGAGINSQGDVVGTSLDDHGSNAAFLYDDGVMSQIDPAASFPFAIDINDAGQIIGYMSTPYDHAALWDEGTLTDLGTLGGLSSHAYAINNFGQIVGSANLPGPNGAGPEHAFLWQDGAMIDLGTLGGSTSVAFGINDLGQIVGRSTTSDGFAAAFLWQDGVMTNLTALVNGPEQPITALGINNSGWIVGSTGIASGPLTGGAVGHAFVMIPQSTPTVTVSDAGGVYSGNAYLASATATGKGGVTVPGQFTFTYYAGTSASGAGSDVAPTNAGVYTVVASFISSDSQYTDAQSDPVTFTINAALPQLVVHDEGGVYSGQPYPASAAATGVDGAPVSGNFVFGYTDSQGNSTSVAPSDSGDYTVKASFTSGDANYSDGQSAALAFSIAQATPTVTVMNAGGTYTGQPFPANGIAVGVGGASVQGTFIYAYYVGDNASGVSSSEAPANPGVYTILASFQSADANYLDGVSDPVTFTITPPKGTKPTILVTDAGGLYNGTPYSASATATGPGGVTVSGSFTFTYNTGVTASGTGTNIAPKNAGTYTVVASFTSADPIYASAKSQPVTFTIFKAPTVTTVISSASTIVAGHAVRFTATVAAMVPDVTAPAATVKFVVDGVKTPVAYKNGRATFTAKALTIGAHTVKVLYPASTNFRASTSVMKQVVQAPLKAPRLLGPTGTIQTATPIFHWNAVGGTEFYDIKVMDTTTGALAYRNQHVLGTTLPSPVTFIAGHHYKWVLRALTSKGNVSPWSAAAAFTVAAAVIKPGPLTFQGGFAGSATATVILPNSTPPPILNTTSYLNNLAGSVTFTINGDGTLLDPYTGTLSGNGQDHAILLGQTASGAPGVFDSPMAFHSVPISSNLHQITAQGDGTMVVYGVPVNYHFAFNGTVSATESNITGTLSVIIHASTGLGFYQEVGFNMGVVAQRQ